MQDWVLSQEGDQWSVKFHVRDLERGAFGYYLSWMVFDFSCQGSSGHFSSGSDFCSPTGFHGRIPVVRSMYLPAALHGIEASLFASDSLRKLRSSIHRVVWSRRQPLASVGAVLSLLDGPTGCDPVFCVAWIRFRLLRRYLAPWPAEVGRVYRLLEMVSEGSSPGHGPIHLLSACAAEIGFQWDPLALGWSRPGSTTEPAQCGTDSSCVGTHGYGATVLAPSVTKWVKSDTTLASELTMSAVWKISLRN